MRKRKHNETSEDVSRANSSEPKVEDYSTHLR
jgi:hypothetical protein